MNFEIGVVRHVQDKVEHAPAENIKYFYVNSLNLDSVHTDREFIKVFNVLSVKVFPKYL